jgi:hypothetical protein
LLESKQTLFLTQWDVPSKPVETRPKLHCYDMKCAVICTSFRTLTVRCLGSCHNFFSGSTLFVKYMWHVGYPGTQRDVSSRPVKTRQKLYCWNRSYGRKKLEAIPHLHNQRAKISTYHCTLHVIAMQFWWSLHRLARYIPLSKEQLLF